MDIMLDPKYASTILKVSKIFLKMADKATTSYGGDRTAYQQVFISLGMDSEQGILPDSKLGQTLNKIIMDTYAGGKNDVSGKGFITLSVDKSGHVNVAVTCPSQVLKSAVQNQFSSIINSAVASNKIPPPDVVPMVFENIGTWSA